jgi:hypothetical protein
MGKPYESELTTLPQTYGWASTTDIGGLIDYVASIERKPLVAIGSGGSLTAAHFAALLHRARGRAIATHQTPLDFLTTTPPLRDIAVLMLSASGRNQDVIAAMDRCLEDDSYRVAAICMRRETSIAAAVESAAAAARVFEFDLPSGKDGFLATNSLLATCVITARIYGSAIPEWRLQEEAFGLLENVSGPGTVIVQYAGWGAPVATDLESKLNESAVASAQLADYRNFGHGRHYWLARRPADTLIVQIVTPDSYDIAERTRNVLPQEIPVLQLRTSHEGPAATIDLLPQAFHLVGELARLQNFDPGRPSVPEFGRKLYHLSPRIKRRAEGVLPVSRKLQVLLDTDSTAHTRTATAFSEFVRRAESVIVGGVVLDYDGTLCGGADRFGSLRKDVAAECTRLLDGGVTIGIATGRGRSVRVALQAALPPSLWARVLVGYYNGGAIAPLDDDNAPDRDSVPPPLLARAAELLVQDAQVTAVARITKRAAQITIEPTRPIDLDDLLKHVMAVIAPVAHAGIRVLASTHSVDVLGPGTGKLSVVRSVSARIHNDAEVLCIGDRGAWPGNDVDLLSHFPSLSVDEVSSALDTCWNIAPRGIRGPDAVVLYLKLLRVAHGGATLNISNAWRNR